MTHIIRFESKAAFEYIKDRIEVMHGTMHNNLAGYVEYLDFIDEAKKAFENAEIEKPKTPVVTSELIPSAPTRKRAPKAKKEEKYYPNLCKTHKLYEAKRPPRTGCEDCWKVYKRLNPMKYDAARRKFDRI